MVDLVIAARLIGGLLLILANGFFVAIEFALTRARQFSEEEFVGDEPVLQRAWEMTDNLELYLTTCQVGITASSIAVGIVAEPALAALFEPLFAGTPLAALGLGTILAFLIINLLHLTHGEQTPTYLGVERSQQVCRYGATPLYWFYWLISPLITLGDWIAKGTLKLFGVEMTGAWLETEQDAIESRAALRESIGESLSQGDLSEEREEEVIAALDIGTITVGDIMIDGEDIVALSVNKSLQENLQTVEDNPHGRFPVVNDSSDDYIGNVYTPGILRNMDALQSGDLDLADIAHDPMSLSPDMAVSEAIDRFQNENQELALVFDDDDGRIVGLLTATDAFEAILGDLEDPLDVEQ